MQSNTDGKYLAESAKEVGSDWAENGYYDQAEPYMRNQWLELIWPIIKGADFSTALDLAAGHGRNTVHLLPLVAKRLYVVDINESNIAFLKNRFKNDSRSNKLEISKNDGASLSMISDSELTFVYCFDAMVHFDSDVVRQYIKEFARVLKSGGTGFIHYSNYDKNPMGSYRDHPGWRNFMSRQLFEHWCNKEGLEVLQTKLVKYNQTIVEIDDGSADAITLFRKL